MNVGKMGLGGWGSELGRWKRREVSDVGSLERWEGREVER